MSTRRGHSPRTYEEDNPLVCLHRAMRLGLKDFVGTTLEPEPDPEIGSYSRTLDGQTESMLKDEVVKNMGKLYSASESEKYAIVEFYDSLPGYILPSHLPVIRWAREQRPDLYRERVEAAILNFATLCCALSTSKREAGKERDRQEIADAYKAVEKKIVVEYEKERKVEQKRAQQNMYCSRAGR